MPEYKTFYSPNGEHSQQVGSIVREKELRFAGWTDKKPAKPTADKGSSVKEASPAPQKQTQAKTTDTPKEITK